MKSALEIRRQMFLGLLRSSGDGNQSPRSGSLHEMKMGQALAGVAQWIKHLPVHLKVAGSIPNQGTCLGCRPGP